MAAEKPFKSILKSLEKPDGGEFGKYYSLPALNDPRRWPRSSKAKFECVFSEVGVVKEDWLSIPVNPSSQETLGHCFIEFNSPQLLLYPL